MAMRLSGAMRCAISLTCAMACSTQAQSYPAKAVRYIVPNSAGSGADTLGRIIAGGLTQLLGQQFVVDNRAGRPEISAPMRWRKRSPTVIPCCKSA
jgi:tripartite-type tricarboxylate transporter receptor subunit TctC